MKVNKIVCTKHFTNYKVNKLHNEIGMELLGKQMLQ